MNLLETLKSICQGSIRYNDLNRLIELAQQFAYTYIKYRYKNLNRTLMAEDITYNEMAVDAIAPLFERDEEGRLIRLINSFNSWEPPIETEKQALFFLNSLVSRSVEKYVAELLKNSDPIFTKILRRINYLVEKQAYNKIVIFGTVYISVSAEEDAGNLPDNQFIYDLPAYLFNDKNNSIKEVMDYLRENTDKTPVIPLNAFILKIKKTMFADVGAGKVSDVKNEIEIDSILNLVLKTSLVKLEESYLNKGKINEEEYEAVDRALNRLLYDLRDGGISSGLHTYLMEEIPELTFETYRSRYQNIFEYLFKYLRKEIVHHIEADSDI